MLGGNKSRSNRRGFTLLEVLLAVSILALVAGLLLAIQHESIQMAGTSSELRALQMLAPWKLDDIMSDSEFRGDQGSFDDPDLDGAYADYSWSATVQSETLEGSRSAESGDSGGSGSVSVDKFDLRATGPSGIEIFLQGYRYEEKERGEESN